jgi:ankyrin repeat protein
VESVQQHLELLLPHALKSSKQQQQQQQHRAGQEARQLLATYILSTNVGLAVSIRPLRNGRTAYHTACFFGDVPFLELVLERFQVAAKEQDKHQDWNTLSETYSSPETSGDKNHTYLNQTCQDSGWTPLHYAVVSGSLEILELLLAAGASVLTLTDDTKTWRTRCVRIYRLCSRGIKRDGTCVLCVK